MKPSSGLNLPERFKLVPVILVLCMLLCCDKWDLERLNPRDPKADNFKPDLPSLFTENPADLTRSSAVSGGNITDNGGGEIIARGVCWSMSENPTVSDNKTTDGNGSGIFESVIAGLVPNTTYYLRAYATNSAGTAYGNQVSFTTLPYMITDVDGNTYNTVRLGTQVWMSENLKTTRYRDGTSIPNIPGNTDWTQQTAGAYCWDKNDISNKDIYGALYNWYAVVDGHYLCPAGWHVPTDDEWTVLTSYLGGESTAGIALKEEGFSHWNIGNNGTNSSGFTALPGGARWNGEFSYSGTEGDWWTSSKSGTETAWRRQINYVNSSVDRDDIMKRSTGMSVRCIEGEGKVQPLLTTADLSNVSENELTSGGNVFSDGGDAISEYGVCWATRPNPVITVDNHTAQSGGTGPFSSNINGFNTNTMYYLRAYANNSIGTAYGNEISFILWMNVDGEGVTDVEGNIYGTVRIGLQEWMKENLETTRYNDGVPLVNETDDGTWAGLTTGGYCWYNNDMASNKDRYGALYNFYAVNTGKLCPAGWHVPTDEDWHKMIFFLDPSSVLGQNESTTAGGKLKEEGTVHWLGPNTDATNESGFTALPGGNRYVGTGQFSAIQERTDWWTSTFNITRSLFFDQAGIFRGSFSNPEYGFSVRCIKN